MGRKMMVFWFLLCHLVASSVILGCIVAAVNGYVGIAVGVAFAAGAANEICMAKLKSLRLSLIRAKLHDLHIELRMKQLQQVDDDHND